MNLFVHQHFLCRCSLVHNIYLCYHTNRPLPVLVPVPSQLQTIRNRHILVRRNHTQNNSLGVLTVTSSHPNSHLLDILLTLHVDSCDTGEIDEGEVGTIVGVDFEFDGVIDYVASSSCYFIG